MIEKKTLKIKNFEIGKGPFVFIGGPCVIEDEDLTFETAENIKEICEEIKIPFIFKSSYLKDNRSSEKSYQGPGIDKGLEILKKIKQKLNVPILSDVHNIHEVEKAKKVLDIIQLPAFLSMQTSLTLSIAKTGKPINIKKGQFLSPLDVQKIVHKIERQGNNNILITERGNFFGYHNIIVDFRSFGILKKIGYPVIFDAGHSIRNYGVSSSSPRGGNREFIPLLARAAIAAGIDGLFLEIHPEPKKALCDSATQWELKKLKPLLAFLKELHEFVKDRI